MKLPWNNEKQKKIEQLESKIQDLEKEKDKLENQYEAEKDRRSKLSRDKQEAEEKLNRLQDKLEGLKGEKVEESEEDRSEMESIGFEEAYGLFKKLSTVKSEKEDLVTVYCPGRFEDFDRRKDLKNSVDKDVFENLSGRKSFIAFVDRDLGSWIIETRPFFSESMSISESFDCSEALEFIEGRKYWVLVAAGDTKIFRESEGVLEEIEHLKSRVDRKHSKGGFSQGRFERKRDEQINQHISEVKEFVEDLEDETFLLGDTRFCEEIPGKRLGGFDPNKGGPEQFYGFRLLNFS